MHDANFSDMSACTFWLQPGAGLSQHAMVMYTTQAWGNATLSFYIATQGFEPWVRLDNVSMMPTPSAAISGTHCLEPGALPSAVGGPEARAKRDATPSQGGATGGSGVGAPSTRVPDRSDSALTSDVTADPEMDQRLDVIQTLDLRNTSSASLSFSSSLAAEAPVAEVQISEDGDTWQTVMQVPPSEDWVPLSIDLSPWSGRVVHVKFAIPGATSRFGRPDTWRIGDVRVSR
jgi:hypothetical protein